MKTKKIIYGFFASLLVLPVVVRAGWGDTGLQNANNSDLPTGTITDIVISLMNWLLALVGIIGIIGFVIAGIIYLTSAGDDNRIGTAKKAMTWSIVGVIVALIGYVIIQAVDTWLNGSSSTF